MYAIKPFLLTVLPLYWLFLAMILLVATIWFLRYKTQHSYRIREAELRACFEIELRDAKAETQEETFQAVAREIHDHITLSLTLAKLHLNTINLNSFEQAESKTKNAINMITEAIDRLRDISHSLNTDWIATQGLVAALENEVERVQKTSVFKIELTVFGNPVFLSTEKEIIIFRVVQECLNNMIKHSHTRFAQVSLTYLSEQLYVVVMDYGVGFKIPADDEAAGKGSGLANIQSRISKINGQVKIESVENDGTIYTIKLPISQENSRL